MLKTMVEILGVIVMIISAAMIGFYVGRDTPPASTGAYNVEYNENTGTVKITTKINYINEEDGKLVIYGNPTFRVIE